ncbi:unnamed protein product [Allacma fusca]|uniref:Peptidase S1 domain-containing protein n=1 Tax=Allacma fusca TaxID=39272 RepID=A0A8J2Q0J5_9HEXA|nr:unnamed protein product [Allacma fusca]
MYKSGSQQVSRYPAPPNSYPNLVSFNIRAQKYDTDNFAGHGILINPLTILTSGSNILQSGFHVLIDLVFFRMGVNNRNTSHVNATYCWHGGFEQLMPGYDSSTKAYNYGLIHLHSPVEFSDKINTIPLAKDGQNFTGPCRYASWMKKRWINPYINSFYIYSDDLEEASLTILPEEQCRQAGFLEPAFCTAQVLCGNQDSGAPLLCKDNGIEYVYGISSHNLLDLSNPTNCGISFSSFVPISKLNMVWVNREMKKAQTYCRHPST